VSRLRQRTQGAGDEGQGVGSGQEQSPGTGGPVEVLPDRDRL